MIDLDGMTAESIDLALSLIPTAIGLGTYYKNINGHGSDDYDPEEDTILDPIGVIPNVRMLKVAAGQEELVGTNVTVEDCKILIPGKDLGNIECGTEDYLDLRGVRYDVIKVRPLPTTALRIVYCRQR